MCHSEGEGGGPHTHSHSHHARHCPAPGSGHPPCPHSGHCTPGSGDPPTCKSFLKGPRIFLSRPVQTLRPLPALLTVVIRWVIIPLSLDCAGQLCAGEMPPQLLLAGLYARLGLVIIIIIVIIITTLT